MTRDVESEVVRVLKQGTKTPRELVAAVREAFPKGIPAQVIIQAVWRLSDRGMLRVHTQHGITLT